jgi:hypothetical protein
MSQPEGSGRRWRPTRSPALPGNGYNESLSRRVTVMEAV